MGMATILDARKIVLIALGEHKAGIIRETAEGPATPTACRPAMLREHRRRLAVARLGRRRQADRRRHALGCWATSSGPTR